VLANGGVDHHRSDLLRGQANIFKPGFPS